MIGTLTRKECHLEMIFLYLDNSTFYQSDIIIIKKIRFIKLSRGTDVF